MKNEVGNLNKEDLIDFLISIKENWNDFVTFPERWKTKDPKEFQILCENFSDYEDNNFVMYKVFFIHLLLENFNLPS